MQKLFCVVALVVGSSVVAGAAAFEGLIDYEIHDAKGRTTPMHYELKEPRLRANMERGDGKSASIIFDTPQNVMYILTPERKMAIKQTIPKPSEQKKPAASSKKMDFTNTGKKDTVAGHECTIYTFQDDSSQGEVCNAEGMGSFHFAGGGSPGASREPSAWEQQSRAKGLFPLRMVTTDLKTGKTTTMLATRIEKKSLPSSDFEVPADYKLIEGFSGLGMAPSQPGAPAFNQADFMKKMMNATPEERQKMSQEMQKNYGNGSR